MTLRLAMLAPVFALAAKEIRIAMVSPLEMTSRATGRLSSIAGAARSCLSSCAAAVNWIPTARASCSSMRSAHRRTHHWR